MRSICLFTVYTFSPQKAISGRAILRSAGSTLRLGRCVCILLDKSGIFSYANDNIELVCEENIFKTFASTQIISGYATDDDDDDIISVNLGFKPKLVICYNSYNHSLSWNTSTGSASSTAGIISPKVISESLQTTGSGYEAYLTNTGFALNTKGYACCYIAFK